MRLPTLMLFAALLLPWAAQAEELYKWIEPDGTITFAKEPPPKGSGINYTRLALDTNEITAATNPQAQPPADLSALAVPATRSPAAAESTTAISPRPLPQQPNPASVPTSTDRSRTIKTEQCQELKKRVTSLERLVMTGVSAETMDNAYIQMARYQNNYNQYCRL